MPDPTSDLTPELTAVEKMAIASPDRHRKVLRGYRNPNGNECSYCEKRVVNMQMHHQRDCKVLNAWRNGRVSFPGFLPFDSSNRGRMPIRSDDLSLVAITERWSAGQAKAVAALAQPDPEDVELSPPVATSLVREIIELAVEQILGDKPVTSAQWRSVYDRSDALILALGLVLEGE